MQTDRRPDHERIVAAVSSAWDQVVVKPGESRAPWTGMDLARLVLDDLRASGFRIDHATIANVLGYLVSSQLLMHRELAALYWTHGDTTLLGTGEGMLDALEIVDVGNVVDQAFASGA